MHPSHGPISQMLGESEEELLKEIKVPQLFMPCGNDPAELKKGGLSEKILGDKLKIVEFPNRQHGFTGRAGTFSCPLRRFTLIVISSLSYRIDDSWSERRFRKRDSRSSFLL